MIYMEGRNETILIFRNDSNKKGLNI